MGSTLAASLPVLVVLTAALGAAFGSFGGVVASRGLRGSLRGRSHCDSCHRRLSWWETIPVVSFVALRGRCRGCAERVAWTTLVWEAGGAAVGVAVAVPLMLSRGL